MPAIRRTLKNVVKNYSDAQVKVREATSNDPWGPSSTLMSEIADLTYNVMAFTEIMQMVWKRLNDDGKNWRHVYKSLVVLDYIIKTGSEKVAQQCKENFHAIKTLTSFQYIDADNKDQGMNVREKAKHLVAMLSDDERLKNERAKALKAKERFAQNAMGVGSSGTTTRTKVEWPNNYRRNNRGEVIMRLGGSPTTGGEYEERAAGYPDSASPGSASASTPSEIESARPSSAGEEELQLQLALAMSKEEHDEQQRKVKSDDIKLQMALEQSREQVKSGPANTTLLDIASSSTAPTQASDPWGMPLPSSQSQPAKDPWGGPLTQQPDPWSSGGATAPPPAYSAVQAPSVSPQPTAFSAVQSSNVSATPPASTDPWGLPVAPQNPPMELFKNSWSVDVKSSPFDAWSSTSPTPSWNAPSPTTVPPQQLDAFGVPVSSAVNGSSRGNPIDNEFDLLSSRTSDTSPTKSPAQGLEEFDLLSGMFSLSVSVDVRRSQFGGPKTNGSSGNAFDMSGLGQDLSSKPKSAESFLGANANLVNLDQLVSRAPPKGNNPFAMTTGNNPFQDPSTSMRMPMAQMPQTAAPGFSQPVNAGLLPQPLLPMGQPQPMQPQQNYNPFL